MKKNLLLLLIGLSLFSKAQSPFEGISYQGVARNASGMAITNATIAVKFELVNVVTSNTDYFEDYTGANGLVCNSVGIFTAIIGSQKPIQFKNIDWALNRYKINIYIDINNGTNYTLIGSQEFHGVPYAYHSEDGVNWKGNQTIAPSIAIKGSVYRNPNTGVTYYKSGLGVWDTLAYSPSFLTGGTQIGQTLYFDGSIWKPTINLFNDGINVGIGLGTQTPNNKFQVANLINFENNGSNVSLGLNAGTNISPLAFYNTFVGYNSGEATSTVNGSGNSANSFFGYFSGKKTTTGNNNSFFGAGSGVNNTTGINNSFFGAVSGFSNTIGNSNSFFGSQSGKNNTTGVNNTFVGVSSGTTNATGSNNTFIGSGADLSSTTAQRTNATAIGYNAKVDADNAIVLGGTGNFSVNVGIGIISPTEKLDVNGNIQIPSAKDYRYDSPKTKYLSVSASAFNTDGPYFRAITPNGGVCIATGTLTAPGYLYAGVNLPDGATITGLDAYVLDTNVSKNISSVTLYSQTGAQGTPNGILSPIASAGPSGTFSTIQKISASPFTSNVDNINYTYFVKVASIQFNTQLVLYKVVITYTIDKAD